jgi:hypothetical protein
MSATIKKLFLLISLLFLFGCSQYGQSNNDVEITVYPVRCDGEVDTVKNSCKGKLLIEDKKAFKVSSSRQEVLFWVPGVSEVPSKLLGCIVRNSKNWQCKNSIYGKIVMEQGHLTTQYEHRIYYISKWRWWNLKFTGTDSFKGALTSKSAESNWYGEGRKGFWDSVLFAVIFWTVIVFAIGWIYPKIKKRNNTNGKK